MNKWIQRICSVSLAVRVSCFIAIMLWVLAGITWWFYATDPTRVGWGSYMTLHRGMALVALWATCVAAVYGGVRVAMNDTPLGHAGVRNAWRAGSTLLAKHGIRWREVPCFLAIGAAPSSTDPSVSQNEKKSETGDCVDWHLRNEGLIASLTGLGRYEPERIDGNCQKTSRPIGVQTDSVRPVMTQDREAESGPSPSEEIPPLEPASSSDEDPSQPGVAMPDVGQRMTTTVEQADRMINEALLSDVRSSQTESVTTARRTLHPSPMESTRALRRERGMVEFLQRLRRERQPYAAINGILAVVPADALRRHSEAELDRATVMGRQLRHDLQLIRDGSGLDVPVTICVETTSAIDLSTPTRGSFRTSNEAHGGWGLHLDPAQNWDDASLKGIADRVVASVVDGVDAKMLSTALDGNHRTVAVADNQQSQRFAAESRAFRSSLSTFLAEAFPVTDENNDDPRLTGVFVDHPDRIWDSTGVVQVMYDQQHELQWTSTTERHQRRQFRFNLALAITLMGLVASAYWQWQ